MYYHRIYGTDLDVFITLFTASLRSRSSIPRIFAKSDANVFSSDLTVKPVLIIIIVVVVVLIDISLASYQSIR
jgi:hypothetical protein